MYKKIDRHQLHITLWERRDRLGRIRLHQREFAKEIGVTYFTVSRLVSELTASGALKKISADQRNIGIYVVREPK